MYLNEDPCQSIVIIQSNYVGATWGIFFLFTFFNFYCFAFFCTSWMLHSCVVKRFGLLTTRRALYGQVDDFSYTNLPNFPKLISQLGYYAWIRQQCAVARKITLDEFSQRWILIQLQWLTHQYIFVCLCVCVSTILIYRFLNMLVTDRFFIYIHYHCCWSCHSLTLPLTSSFCGMVIIKKMIWYS